MAKLLLHCRFPLLLPSNSMLKSTSVLTHEHLLSLLLSLLSLAFNFYPWAPELPHSLQPYKHHVCKSLPLGRSLPAPRALWSMPCHCLGLLLSGITGHVMSTCLHASPGSSCSSGGLLQMGYSPSASEASRTYLPSRGNTPKKGSGERWYAMLP